MIQQLKIISRQIPGFRALRERVHRQRERSNFRGSASYWQDRYSTGGTSGSGSYGHLAEFKASILNCFVADQKIASVFELGCGDGNQLLYARYPRYIGLDVARAAILLCRKKFEQDFTKSFFVYDPEGFVDHQRLFRADLAMSLDVLFHLVEDAVFERYLNLLFAAADRFVIIYSSNIDWDTGAPQERHRKFTEHVAKRFPKWRLKQVIKNEYPYEKNPGPAGSLADFYVYEQVDGTDGE